uniref:RNA helicase n=1 Tax=Globodera pallida TaxID=36090 RepID=A0A183BRQ6_GLOPA
MAFSRRQLFGERHPLIGGDRYFNDRLTNREAIPPNSVPAPSRPPSSPRWEAAPNGSLSSFDNLSVDDGMFGQPDTKNGVTTAGGPPHFPSQSSANGFGRGGSRQPVVNSFVTCNQQNGGGFSSTSSFQAPKREPNGYRIEEVPPPQQPPPPLEPRRRRQKYLPPTRPDVELFNENNHIQPGPLWKDQFGIKNDTNLSVSCQDGSQFEHLVQEFEECGFSNAILRNIQLRKYNELTQVQKSVIPVIQKHRSDLMAHAQTGSGKSAAFLLPIINLIQTIKSQSAPYHPANSDSPFALVLEPSKELCYQLWEDARSFAINTGVSVQRTYGDMPVRESKRQIESGCDICMVTCGRLSHFVNEGTIKLGNLRFLVLDEADRLLTCEHFHFCVSQIKNNASLNPNHRVLMFSATFDSEVQLIASTFLRPNYVFITVGVLNSVVDTVNQEFVEVQRYSKQEKLLEILKKDAIWKTLPNGDHFLKPAKKTLVFVETRRNSDRLAIALTQEKFYNTQSLNGDRTLEQRHLAFRKFIHGHYDVLVSTDVAARGVNIPNVDHVINYDLPERMEDNHTYVHRIGRAGRAGNTGLATSFFDSTSPEDLAKAAFYVQVLSIQADRLPHLLVPDFLLRCASSGNYFDAPFVPTSSSSNFGNSFNDRPNVVEGPRRDVEERQQTNGGAPGGQMSAPGGQMSATTAAAGENVLSIQADRLPHLLVPDFLLRYASGNYFDAPFVPTSSSSNFGNSFNDRPNVVDGPRRDVEERQLTNGGAPGAQMSAPGGQMSAPVGQMSAPGGQIRQMSATTAAAGGENVRPPPPPSKTTLKTNRRQEDVKEWMDYQSVPYGAEDLLSPLTTAKAHRG